LINCKDPDYRRGGRAGSPAQKCNYTDPYGPQNNNDGPCSKYVGAGIFFVGVIPTAPTRIVATVAGGYCVKRSFE